MLEAQGVTLNFSPLARHLHRVGVAAVMDRNIRRVNRNLTRKEADEILKTQPNWLLIEHKGQPTHFMPAAELALYISTLEEETAPAEDDTPPEEEVRINLLEIPAQRDNVTPVLLSATLHEALETMKKADVSAVYVRRMSAPNIYRVFGVVRKQDIEHYYQI